jgi:23S rRNA (cytosine1962-C5)-methyltransferase
MNPLSRVTLHPASLKHIKLGHPWVTKDQYTDLFPKREPFLLGVDAKGQSTALLMNDPNHPTIKARVWTLRGDLIEQSRLFPRTLKERLVQSFKKRREIINEKKRDNVCLVFEESDELPGIQILTLGPIHQIFLYSGFWHLKKRELLQALNEAYIEAEIPLPEYLVIQKRNQNQMTEREIWRGPKRLPESMIIQEFGINYELRFKDNYDHGIYTDMAAIREKLADLFENSKVLNLYCYTGAFSLYALKNGASEVVSVDLSKNYLDWLDHNLSLNPSFDGTKHTRVEASALDYLKACKEESFDLVICDPPSASSDGKKKMNALQMYETQMSKLEKIVRPKGRLVLVLNTHSISMNKFEAKIRSLCEKRPLKIVQTLVNCDDYKGVKTLPESRYLKILVLQKD